MEFKSHKKRLKFNVIVNGEGLQYIAYAQKRITFMIYIYEKVINEGGFMLSQYVSCKIGCDVI